MFQPQAGEIYAKQDDPNQQYLELLDKNSFTMLTILS